MILKRRLVDLPMSDFYYAYIYVNLIIFSFSFNPRNQ